MYIQIYHLSESHISKAFLFKNKLVRKFFQLLIIIINYKWVIVSSQKQKKKNLQIIKVQGRTLSIYSNRNKS